jgi:hypothetical protein
VGDNGEHAHQLRLSVIRLRQAMQQVSAYADRIDSVAYKLDGHSAAEFFQGPPINVTGGEDPGDYLERIRSGEEPGTVDNLSAARDWLATHLPEARSNEDAIAMVAVTKAHALIAQADLMVEHLRLVAESVELQRQALALHQQGQALAEKITAARPIDRLVELPRQNGGVYLIDPEEVSRVESTGPTAIDTWVDLRGHSEEDCMHVGLPCEETLRRLRGETGSAEEGEG